MIFDTDELKKRGREDFEKAWHSGPSFLTPPTTGHMYPRLIYKRARPHPVFETYSASPGSLSCYRI